MSDTKKKGTTRQERLDLPDCTRLNQRLPETKRRMTTKNKSYNMNEAWVRALPSQVGEIEGFERHEDWIDGFGVYARLRNIADFTEVKKVRNSNDVRNTIEGYSSSSSYECTPLVSETSGSAKRPVTPSVRPRLSLASDVPSLWVSFDTEFAGGEAVSKRWDGKRSVVSWQFCFARGDDLVELMVVPRTERPLCLSHAINLVCELAGCGKRYYPAKRSKRSGKKSDKGDRPISVTLISHAGIVDLTTFTGSKHLLQRMADNGGAIFNAMDYVLKIVRDRDRNTYREVSLKVRDTLSFTAKGTSLRMMGEGLSDGDSPSEGSLRKLDMSEEDYLDMGRVLREEPERFADYAIRDVEICWAYMARFLDTHDREFAVTIPALSARYLKDYLIGNEYGDYDEFERRFRGMRKSGSRDRRTDKYYVDDLREPVNIWAEDFSTHCRNAYKGGMNACTLPGYYDCETYDYDLTSAYPLSLGSLRDPDFELPPTREYGPGEVLSEDDPNLQDPFTPGAGQVTFEFPEGCYQPCIAVPLGDSLVFPRTSGGAGVYVTMPEVVCALRLGAKVTALRFEVFPTANDVTVLRGAFKSLIDARAAAAAEYGKKSVQALAMKLVANTLYGKMAQALSPKRHRDLFKLEMVDLKSSPVTSPYHAATGTAITRCIMAVASNQLRERGYRVFSTTTDGFISDAPKEAIDGLDLLGLRDRLKETRLFYTDGETDDIFEVKHVNEALMNLTTRGNVAPNVEGVFARAGLKGYPESEPDASGVLRPTSRYRALFMARALNRKGEERGKAHFSSNQWESAADMLANDEDFHTFAADRSAGLNFDLKRKPVADTMEDVQVDVPEVSPGDGRESLDGATTPLATFDTVPYEDPEEFWIWKSWATRPLIEKADFERLAEDAATGMRVQRGDTHRDAVRFAFTAHRGGFALIPKLNELAGTERMEWINTFLSEGERPFTTNDWKNAHRQNRIHALPQDREKYAYIVEEMGGRFNDEVEEVQPSEAADERQTQPDEDAEGQPETAD